MKRLKPVHLRKPKDPTSHEEMLKEVSEETGFARTDIRIVIEAWTEKIQEELLDRRAVRIKNIGTLFPMVQPPRRVTNMGGNDGDTYEDMIMQARWKVKFQILFELREKIRDIMVTKRDLEKIYFKEDE